MYEYVQKGTIPVKVSCGYIVSFILSAVCNKINTLHFRLNGRQLSTRYENRMPICEFHLGSKFNETITIFTTTSIPLLLTIYIFLKYNHFGVTNIENFLFQLMSDKVQQFAILISLYYEWALSKYSIDLVIRTLWTHWEPRRRQKLMNPWPTSDHLQLHFERSFWVSNLQRKRGTFVLWSANWSYLRPTAYTTRQGRTKQFDRDLIHYSCE